MVKPITDISTISESIRTKKVSPVEIAKACFDRIEKLNPTLNAFIMLLKNVATEQAKSAESKIKSGQWRGPLQGIPVGIKDLHDTDGIKTTAAFKYFKDRCCQRNQAERNWCKHHRKDEHTSIGDGHQGLVNSPSFADKAALWFGYTLAAITIPCLLLGVKIQTNWNKK